ncbi:MAG: hypothetical protein M3Y87_20070 [Myxococcota bacterium]|nr:hypothetical protein [Myxococcota bacterium]
MNAKTGGFVAAGCGGLLLLSSLAGVALFAFNVFIDSGGAMSADEAAPGLGAACCCSFTSLLIVVGGIVAAVRAGKNAAQ